jgi:hypothetical protein
MPKRTESAGRNQTASRAVKASQKMDCFCTAGMLIRAIQAISEDVISAMGNSPQPLFFPVFVAKSLWICARGRITRECSSPT